jgi:two-component system NtrC family sensor kinase
MSNSGHQTTSSKETVSLLAQTPRLIDALPALHQAALEATGGCCTLLFEYNPRDGALVATSGYALDALPSERLSLDAREAAALDEAFAARSPKAVPHAARQMPDVAARLGTPHLLILPLARGAERVGVLAIGFAEPPAVSSAAEASAVADQFVVALELFRLREADELRRDVRALLSEFAGSVSATLTVAAGLDLFCDGANRLFGADRTSVWLHDRRARHLVLQASSDQGHAARGARIGADDPLALPSAAMRHSRAEIVPGGAETATATVTVPLRGCRRALGTVVFEGVRVEPGRELALLDRADELGRQLSSAIENMQLLDEVMRSRRELENTFDSITDLVAVSDRRGRIVHANHAFAARVGRSRGELLEQPLADYVGPDLAAWLAAHDARDARAADPAMREISDARLNGSFIVTLTDLLNQDRERAGSVLVARDLTPQTRLETEREALRKRLTQSEKLAALGQFVAGIAHELNNPLQGVLGHLELLRATGAFPKQLRREVQTIYREADRAAKIVRNLLVFAGSRRLARRSVSVNGVMQKVLTLRAAACRAADIEVVRHYDEKLPRVPSDPLLIHQAFLNIVMNAEQAIAATGGPGRIDVTTAVAPGGQAIVVTVRDTGGGIPPDALPRIFEPFYTTKEVGKGTGLGLAIAYGIVQEHGGQIVAANHPESGAVFTIELPATPGRRRND